MYKFISLTLIFSIFSACHSFANNEYILGPGDIVGISVTEDVKLSTRKATIDSKGEIRIGYAGHIKISGLTLDLAEKKIKEVLEKDFLREATVTVEIKVYGSKKVRIYGEVRRPGTYALKGKTHILEALTLAGGKSSRASNTVVIIRNYGDIPPLQILQGHREKKDSLEVVKPGKKRIQKTYDYIATDISNLHRGGRDIELQKGDFMYVKPAAKVTVTGAVSREGVFYLPNKTDLVQLIAKAGGFKSSAKKSSVRVKRDVDGKLKDIELDYDSFIDDNEKPFIMKDGDVIVVPESLF